MICPVCKSVDSFVPEGRISVCNGLVKRPGDLTPSWCGWTIKADPTVCKCGSTELRVTEKNGKVTIHVDCDECHKEYMRNKCRENSKRYEENRKKNPNFAIRRKRYMKERRLKAKLLKELGNGTNIN